MSSFLIVRARPAGPRRHADHRHPGRPGWGYVGFEVLAHAEGPAPAGDSGGREVCIVVIGGRVDDRLAHGAWHDGGAPTRSAGLPDAAYLPPATPSRCGPRRRLCEVGLCFARPTGAPRPACCPAQRSTPRRADTAPTSGRPPDPDGGRRGRVAARDRGADAGRPLVELPAAQARPRRAAGESYLEETYYHRIDPPQGFVIQRVYSETVARRGADVRDRESCSCRAATTPSAAPPGYRSYYLNVMAGPKRAGPSTTTPTTNG